MPPLRCWPAIFLGVLVSFVHSSPAANSADHDPKSLEAKLRALDDVYSSAFQAHGTEVIDGLPGGVGPPSQSLQWSFTLAAQQCVARQDFDAPDKDDPGFTVGDDGRPAALTTLRVITFASSDICAQMREVAEYTVADDGEVIAGTGRTRTADFYPGGSQVFSRSTLPIMWVMGRGFFPFINRVSSVEMGADNKNVEVTADGWQYKKEYLGVWRLRIDIASAYMVRAATFTPMGSQSLSGKWLQAATR